MSLTIAHCKIDGKRFEIFPDSWRWNFNFYNSHDYHVYFTVRIDRGTQNLVRHLTWFYLFNRRNILKKTLSPIYNLAHVISICMIFIIICIARAYILTYSCTFWKIWKYRQFTSYFNCCAFLSNQNQRWELEGNYNTLFNHSDYRHKNSQPMSIKFPSHDIWSIYFTKWKCHISLRIFGYLFCYLPIFWVPWHLLGHLRLLKASPTWVSLTSWLSKSRNLDMVQITWTIL